MKRIAVLLCVVIVCALGSPIPKSFAADAKELYEKNCAKCHGLTGKGDGKAAITMKLKAADYTDKAFMSKITDEEMVQAITKGGKVKKADSQMPAYEKKLKPEEIKLLVAYIRSFSK